VTFQVVEVTAAVPEAAAAQALAARYRAAVLAIAEAIVRELDARALTGDEAWEHAVEEAERWRWPATSPHAWIFTSRLTLAFSENVTQALDVRPEGDRAWDPDDLDTAPPVVAEFDVLSMVGELREMDPAEGAG
jgi:DNA-directed RNA polymerase specialized sigma24 family protein